MSDQENFADPTGQTPEASSGYPVPFLRYYVFECATNVFRSLLGEVGANPILEASRE
jgi:hypothetical protein